MSLDETAKEVNLRGSVKKYFVDEVYPSYELTFDNALNVPKIQGIAIKQWVTVLFGESEVDHLGYYVLDIYLCTRQDPEGYNLSVLADFMRNKLTDSSGSDGAKRIDLYNVGSWTKIGGLVVQEIIESQEMDAPDMTKFKVFTCRLRWAAKI